LSVISETDDNKLGACNRVTVAFPYNMEFKVRVASQLWVEFLLTMNTRTSEVSIWMKGQQRHCGVLEDASVCGRRITPSLVA